MTIPESRVPAWAAAVCDGVHAAGSRDVVYVPDNPLSHVLRDVRERLPDVRLVLATREEEAFGIAAGLFLGGKRPTVMLQSSGLGNSLNALTSLLIPYRIPVLLVVSMFASAPHGAPRSNNSAARKRIRSAASTLTCARAIGN